MKQKDDDIIGFLVDDKDFIRIMDEDVYFIVEGNWEVFLLFREN